MCVLLVAGAPSSLRGRTSEAVAEAKLARAAPPDRPGDDLDAWVEETGRPALAYAVTLVRNRAEAEDIVHDCYIRLLARSDRYDLPRDGTRLLFKAISNACINWTQRRPPVVSLDAAGREGGAGSLTPAVAADDDPVERAALGELEAGVAAALAELPVAQRAAVELRSLGHAPSEIAEMLGISRANARVLLHRARQALAARLRPFIEGHRT